MVVFSGGTAEGRRRREMGKQYRCRRRCRGLGGERERREGGEGSGDDGGDVGMGWDGMGLWIWMESITVTADYPCLSLPNPLPGLFSFFIFNIVTDQTGYVILR